MTEEAILQKDKNHLKNIQNSCLFKKKKRFFFYLPTTPVTIIPVAIERLLCSPLKQNFLKELHYTLISKLSLSSS